MAVPRLSRQRPRRTAPPLAVAASYGASAASFRVRVLEWLRVLGVQAEVHDYLGTSDVRPRTLAADPLGVLRAEARLRRWRLQPAPERLWLSRSLGPLSGGRLEQAALRRAGWGVYDFDDALFADERTGVHRYLGEAAGWARSVRAADLVIAGNDHLAEAAARLNPAVEVVPSCVEPDAYPQKRSYEVGPVPRLVWLGSPSTEPYLQPVAPALLEVHRRTGARLTVISAGARPLGALEAMTDRVAWDGARTDALLAEADCGLMPLPDTPFSRGKCAYKLLQYGAAGLPAVASPVGVNARVLDQLDGLAATDTTSWVDAVTQLLQEGEAARRARGLAARRGVEQHYSYTAWAPVVARALGLPAQAAAPALPAGSTERSAGATGSPR